jgi:hypothetical protein
MLYIFAYKISEVYKNILFPIFKPIKIVFYCNFNELEFA